MKTCSWWCMAVVLAASGCEYDPPPEILESFPALGAIVSDPAVNITVRFSEPIDPQSLLVTLSPREVDSEGELLPFCQGEAAPGCIPMLAGYCTSTTCPGGKFRLAPDQAGFMLDPDQDLTIGNYLLRVHAGLKDQDGNDTGVPYDLHFYYSPCGSNQPTTFESMVVLALIELDRPLVFPLDVYFNLVADPETGEFTLGGCDADQPVPGPRTLNTQEWTPVHNFDLEGYKFASTGVVQDVEIVDDSGKVRRGYCFQNKPAYIYCNNPEVEVFDGVFTGTILFNEETGRYDVEGSLMTPRVHIFDSPEHANPQEASGVLWGVSLKPEEIGDDWIWQGCADPDPCTVTCPEWGCPPEAYPPGINCP